VLPRVSAVAMSTFLAAFAQTVSDDTHVVMVLDQAGWHDARALRVPETVTLVSLPAYSPELNPVERVWLYFGSAISRIASWPTTRLSWKPAAMPGMRSQPKQDASAHSLLTPTSNSSALKRGGIMQPLRGKIISRSRLSVVLRQKGISAGDGPATR
jgi:DDE superfamily endonuclease